MHTCVVRLSSALSPGLLENGAGEELWKMWGGPASPGDGGGGGCAIPELRPFNRQLGTPLHKSQLLGMC